MTLTHHDLRDKTANAAKLSSIDIDAHIRHGRQLQSQMIVAGLKRGYAALRHRLSLLQPVATPRASLVDRPLAHGKANEA